MTNIGINGFGRIGRLVAKIVVDHPELNLVAINYPSHTTSEMARMLKYDTIQGKIPHNIRTTENQLVINGESVDIYRHRDPNDIPWSQSNVNLVVDTTGIFTTVDKASAHLGDGVDRVVISAPSRDAPMYVMGVNEDDFDPDHQIISNASCTTNCLAPVVKVLDQKFGIVDGLMTTIHAVTASQNVVDSSSGKNLRIGRAAYSNLIPSSTGAAKAVGKVYKPVDGKLTGTSLRVPVPNVSVVDLNVKLSSPASLDDIFQSLRHSSENELKGILTLNDEGLVSSDFVGNTHSCIVDTLACMQISQTFFKIVCWYDNETGYANRLVELVAHTILSKEKNKECIEKRSVNNNEK